MSKPGQEWFSGLFPRWRREMGKARKALVLNGFFALLVAAFVSFFIIRPLIATEIVNAAEEVRPGLQGLAPHKALYDIELVGTRSGSQVVNISGQMMYEWESSCDAWLSNHRFNLFYEYADSPAMRITSDFSTYEAFDGRSLDFTSQRKREGRLFEEIRGRATLNRDGSGQALYTIPSDLAFELPEGTLFPARHTLGLLSEIRKGAKFYTATVFDGSDKDGPVEISAFIGREAEAPAAARASADIDSALLNAPAWKVRLAFFPLFEPESASDYEMSAVFHENGIISDMVIEYDDFTIAQKLVALEPLEDGCRVETGKPARQNGKK